MKGGFSTDWLCVYIAQIIHRSLLAVFIVGSFCISNVLAQNLSPSDPKMYWYRLSQINGNASGQHSLNIRSFEVAEYDGYSGNRYKHWSIKARLSEIQWANVYNSTFPTGYNNGSIFESRGIATRFSSGFYLSAGPLSVQLQPEIILSQNSDFDRIPAGLPAAVWGPYANEIANRIDAPERFTSGSYTRVLPGQSSVRLNWRSLSAGVSTEYLWWGPGVRHSLILTDNAEGFRHITLNTRKPITGFLGGFEFQYIFGRLDELDFIESDTKLRDNGRPFINDKRDDWRVFTGLILTYQPAFMDGLSVGVSRTFVGYSGDIQSFGDYFPLLQPLRKELFQDEENPFGDDQFDQRLSAFFRWVFPGANFELYAEYGREDHSQDLRDVILEPQHSRAYLIGFQRYHQLDFDRGLLFGAEVIELATTSTRLVRAAPSWYVHHIVRHGYTQMGQVLGSGIGPGSNSLSFWVDYVHKRNRLGLEIERITHNDDFYIQIRSIEGAGRSYSYSPGVRFEYNVNNFGISGVVRYNIHRNRHYLGVNEAYQELADHDASNWHFGFNLSIRID